MTTNREHGTRASYCAGCHCQPCTAANTAYRATVDRLILYGQWQPYVDAQPARAHLQALSAAGIGKRRAAQLSGVSASAIDQILYGGSAGREPSRRIRPETAAKILAVKPSAAHLAPSAIIDPTGTIRRLQALVAIGWSQTKLASRLGVLPTNFSALITGRYPQVTAGRHREVCRLYDELWNKQPPEHDHHSRAAASRARNHAAARGWPVPAAWDDDTIDLPAATPADGWKRPAKRSAADTASEARELMDRFGLTREQAADRLGIKRSYLDTVLMRHPAAEAAA